jgi:TRAP-type C4-dicarboxylate transport system substrate-binding protein
VFSKRFMVLIAGILVAALIIVGCGQSGSKTGEASEPSTKVSTITLTYSDHDPPGGMRTEFIKNVWFPEIEKQTNGRVKINANFGGSLLSSTEALDGAAGGVADMVMIFSDFYPEKMFGFQIYKLFPRSPEKWENTSYVFETSMKELPMLQQELEKHNLKPLLVTVGLPSVFGATYKIEGVKDIVNKKWRASSRWHLETLKHIGSNAVSVPWEDVYISLETGVIDGVMTNYDGFHMMRFYEPAKEIVLAPQLWWGTPFLHTINTNVWNSLPEDIQQGILKATEIAQQKFGDLFASELERTVEEQRAAGCNVKIADEEDVALVDDPVLLTRLREIWIKEAVSTQGLTEEEAQGYMDKMEQIMNEALAREG